MKRWYDKNKTAAAQLDALIQAPPATKIAIVKGILDIIRENADKDVIDRFTVPPDIDLWSRRDYDDEAAIWIVINNLKYVDEALLNRVAEYIAAEISADRHQ